MKKGHLSERRPKPQTSDLYPNQDGKGKAIITCPFQKGKDILNYERTDKL